MATKKLTAQLGLDKKDYDRGLKDAAKGAEQLAGKFSQLGGIIGGAFAVGGIGAAFTLLKKGIENTGSASEKLEFQIAGVQGAAIALGQNLITLDFSRSFIDAYKASKQLAETMDDIQDQAISLSILDSANAVKIAKLRNDLKDIDLSTAQRLEKEKEIQRTIEDELAAHKAITEQKLAAINTSYATKYGISTEDAQMYLEYLTNYSRLTEEQRKQLALALQLNKATLEQKRNSGSLGQLDVSRTQEYRKIQAAAESLPPELKKYLSISNLILDTTDKEKQKIAETIIEYNRANVVLLKQSGFADRIADKLGIIGDNAGDSADKIRQMADAYKLWNDQVRVNNNQPALGNIPDSSQLAPMKIGSTAVDLSGLTNFNTLLSEEIPNSISSLTSAFGELFAGGQDGWKELATSALGSIKKIIDALLVEAITAMYAGEAHKGLLGLLTASVGVAALMSAIPKLANGGIAYGPTQAVVGEYSGAKNNPEVIAPLDKLKGMMTGGQQSGDMRLVGKLRGRDIYISAERYAQSLGNNT